MTFMDLHAKIADWLIRHGEHGVTTRYWFEQFDHEHGVEWRAGFPEQPLPSHFAERGWSHSDVACVAGLSGLIRDSYVRALRDTDFQAGRLARQPAAFQQIVIDADQGLVALGLLRTVCQEFGIRSPMYPAIPGVLNANLDLYDALGALMSGSTAVVRVRPDILRTVPTSEWVDHFERARWHGKPFDAARLSGLREAEEAEHAPDLGQMGMRTQFIWEPKDGRLQFAVEELPDPDVDVERIAESSGELLVATRFAHGIFNQRNGQFEHLDGHVHLYTLDNYALRESLRLGGHFDGYEKYKVFSIDPNETGAPCVAAQAGFDVVCAFFRWNEMVREYFDGAGK